MLTVASYLKSIELHDVGEVDCCKSDASCSDIVCVIRTEFLVFIRRLAYFIFIDIMKKHEMDNIRLFFFRLILYICHILSNGKYCSYSNVVLFHYISYTIMSDP